VQKGNLPIIISAPHGGNDVITGVPVRTGVGVTDFTTVRDNGTEELAYALATAVQQRFGKKPYVVVSKASRSYVDLNRSAANAYEHPDAQVVYEYYHNTMKLYSRTVANKFHCGLVIDLHGQGTSSTTVFRGTRNGATVRHLRSAYGQSAHDGPNSMFGLLATKGWVVDPLVLSATENSSFNGGYIVGTYGSQVASAVDAIQFEFGSNYRGTSAQRTQTVTDLTDALVTYARLYLRVRVPN
jgi:N-formylglutamate amidohydrolase